MARPRKDRTERIPFGVMSQKMTLDHETMKRLKSQRKVPRWINDTDNRIMGATQGGYEFVNDNGPTTTKVGDKEVERDCRIKKLVGTNKDSSPMYAYLMAISSKYHTEDQETKEDTNKAVDDAVRGGTPAGLKNHGVAGNQGGVSVKKVSYTP